MKILHIVENLDKGTVENYLVELFLASKKKRPDWEWSFYCILGKPGRLDKIVKDEGGKIFYTKYELSQKFLFLRSLREHLKKNRYDVIHYHHDYLSGYYLLATLGIKFNKRILHIHNTDKDLPVTNKAIKNIFLPIFKTIAILLSDSVIGISHHALNSFLTFPFNKIVNNGVIYYIINFDKFHIDEDHIHQFKVNFFEEEKIPPNTKIMLFTGRLYVLKNPVFVIDILKKLIDRGHDIVAVFVGKGDKELEIIDKADSLGLTERIRILGWRDDASKIMQISNVFVFPRVESPKEGLGLVVAEAQCADLPMVLSRGIVDEAIVIPELTKVVQLKNNPEEWADKIELLINDKMRRKNSIKIMKESRFSVDSGINSIIDLYEQ